MARLRGTKAGQRGTSYLIPPAIYVLRHRADDKDLDKSLGWLQFYVADLDRGRFFRSEISEKLSSFKAPDGIEYNIRMPFYHHEEALRESANVLIDRLFGIDYKTVPRFDVPSSASGSIPGAAGPLPFSSTHNFNSPNFNPAAFGTQGFGSQHQGFGYGPKAYSPVPRNFPINPAAPFSELVTPEQREGLARMLGLTMTGLINAWADVEKDFDFPEVPYEY